MCTADSHRTSNAHTTARKPTVCEQVKSGHFSGFGKLLLLLKM